MQTILITGGTGLVGKALAKAIIQKGHAVIILTRKIPESHHGPGIRYARWDIPGGYIDPIALADATAIIHLAGAGVMEKKWTPEYKDEILKSRVDSSTLLIQALKIYPHKVRSFISTSAIGFYGLDKDPVEPFIEEDSPAVDFLGETCKLWEESVEPATQMGIRLVKFRMGIVLTAYGGALQEFLKPLQFRVAAILGNGKQIISWVHLEDLCRMLIYALEKETLNGTFNAVAPLPVSNKELTLTLAKTVRGKNYLSIHVPAFIIKLMMGKRSTEVLKSTTVSCRKIIAEGFEFLYPSIDDAISHLVATKDQSL